MKKHDAGFNLSTLGKETWSSNHQLKCKMHSQLCYRSDLELYELYEEPGIFDLKITPKTTKSW